MQNEEKIDEQIAYFGVLLIVQGVAHQSEGFI